MMKTTRTVGVTALMAIGLLLVAGCRDLTGPRTPDVPAVAADDARFGVPPSRVELESRTPLAGDVVHYRYRVPVGAGPFDVIRLHRVVREPSSAHGRPLSGLEGVLLLPGAPQLFEGIFLPPGPAPGGSVAVFLAAHDIDVWGMDYGWSALPHNPAQDFTPLRGWGIAKDTEHVTIALSHARRIRATTGQGAGPIHLLGFSYGGFLLYAAAGEDTRRPGNLRNVKGIIPVEGAPFKAVSPAGQAASCASLEVIQADLDAGSYAIDRSIFRVLGQLALAAPDEPSAIVPPFSNYNAPLALLVSTRFFTGSIVPPDVSLVFTDPDRVITLLANTPPYVPRQAEWDMAASRCDSPPNPVAFDDHLGDIRVPIFYIDRTPAKLGTIDRTQSTDVTTLVVNPMLDPALYGHADFFLANNAADEIWQSVLDWIAERR